MHGADYPTDMDELTAALDAAGIRYLKKPHPITADGMAGHRPKDIIGYNPAGDWQVIITPDNGSRYSVIRGMVSFGHYEIMQTEGDGPWADDPARFDDVQELIGGLNGHSNRKQD